MDDFSDELLMNTAEQFGTPLYVYASSRMKENYLQLKNSFCNAVDVFYSLKANPNKTISEKFQSLGAGAEVCSGAELKTALLSGYDPQNIIFVGPVKKTRDLIKAIENNIYAIVCESKEELAEINELAKVRRKIVDVAIRVNPLFSMQGASLKMGGAPSQFGIDQEELFQNKKFFLEKKWLNIRGIHVFNGSRVLNAEVFLENIKNILTLSDELSKTWNKSFSMVDIGGGIGVPYFKHEKPFDLNMVKQSIQLLMKSHHDKRIILESGRYLMADAGVFITRIENIKLSRKITFLITDGGMNCHLSAAGFGGMLKRNFPIKLLNRIHTTKKCRYHVAGPLCTPADLLAQNIELTEARVGDYIIVFASGAYGLTASPVLFLGHQPPSEVLLSSENSTLI